MRRNVGETKLRKRRRQCDTMSDFDKMPIILRKWLNEAALPWGPRSVLRVYNKAFLRTGDPNLALADLDRVQKIQLSKDRADNFKSEQEVYK